MPLWKEGEKEKWREGEIGDRGCLYCCCFCFQGKKLTSVGCRWLGIHTSVGLRHGAQFLQGKEQNGIGGTECRPAVVDVVHDREDVCLGDTSLATDIEDDPLNCPAPVHALRRGENLRIHFIHSGQDYRTWGT